MLFGGTSLRLAAAAVIDVAVLLAGLLDVRLRVGVRGAAEEGGTGTNANKAKHSNGSTNQTKAKQKQIRQESKAAQLGDQAPPRRRHLLVQRWVVER